jgi:hypothetical protein
MRALAAGYVLCCMLQPLDGILFFVLTLTAVLLILGEVHISEKEFYIQ